MALPDVQIERGFAMSVRCTAVGPARAGHCARAKTTPSLSSSSRAPSECAVYCLPADEGLCARLLRELKIKIVNRDSPRLDHRPELSRRSRSHGRAH